MAAIEAGLRGGGIAILLLLAFLGWRDGHRPAARYGVLFMLCAAAYLVESAPGLAAIQPPWIVPLRLMSAAAPALFQLWVSAMFDDAFRPSWWRWLPTAAMFALTSWALVAHRWLPWRVVEAAVLLLVAIGIWQILRGRETDLVEGRRRLRPILSIGSGLAIAAFTVLASLSAPEIRAYAGIVCAAIVVALATLSAILRLGLRTDPELVSTPADIVAASRNGPPTAETVAIDPDERALLSRLRRLMEEERVYRTEGLSIGALATRLGLPEYRLRQLINQRLGHRNFTGFINTYRLGEVTAALADPAQAQVPILTIALDAGFQSIGPFNRAFKAQTGMTPTDFRRQKLEAPPPDRPPISKSASL
ncbi:MAG TPA: helix-turn-helix domain-containing protein [Stellaceae bacterium]|nr:helix-turn-helix domain-containing protein [Stellaceae bacterium]